jgi:hypothetical protein
VSRYAYVTFIKIILRLVWWYIPVIPALGKLRQEDHEFKANLGSK